MPARPSALYTVRSSLARRVSRPYICPSCSHKRNLSAVYSDSKFRRRPHLRKHPHPLRKQASSIAPVTAVNATKDIPPAYRALYDELSALGGRAGTYVDLSQLQLALRGLESKDSVTRVALLVLNGNQGVYSLVRALLADPLSPESPWEGQLEKVADDERKSLLIRYGEELEYDQRHPLMRSLSIPSGTLRSHKLEILIQKASWNGDTVSLTDGSNMLVPALETPISASGRFSAIRYPVHKVIAYGEGVQGMLAYYQTTYPNVSRFGTDMVTGVINVRWRDRHEDEAPQHHVNIVNLEQATTSITQFRMSLENAMAYEHGWLGSKMPEVTRWVLDGTEAKDSSIKSSLKNLITVVLNSTENSILEEESQRLQELTSASIPESVRQELHAGIRTWAEHAHTELRDRLEIAFHSRSWNRLAWWKLLWRVDDVGMLASDILGRAWLVEAEKEIIWVGGRIQQAGLLGVAPQHDPNNSPLEALITTPPIHTLGSFPPPPRLLDVMDIMKLAADSDATLFNPSHPWPQQISVARTSLALSTVPALQALSQRLLLQSVSTTAITSFLSSLMYVSLSTTSIYEAGAVAAFGFVYSMRRLQTKWEAARAYWQGEVREEGRKVLKHVERVVREVVREGGKVEVGVEGDEVGVEERRVAREVAARARRELEKLG